MLKRDCTDRHCRRPTEIFLQESPIYVTTCISGDHDSRFQSVDDLAKPWITPKQQTAKAVSGRVLGRAPSLDMANLNVAVASICNICGSIGIASVLRLMNGAHIECRNGKAVAREPNKT